ncbi:MAG: hypothetical protein JWO39_906 [Gemmatimonadetes bacterium]|nr:hypothetical protein [Gemmatimonadota bacterium]
MKTLLRSSGPGSAYAGSRDNAPTPCEHCGSVRSRATSRGGDAALHRAVRLKKSRAHLRSPNFRVLPVGSIRLSGTHDFLLRFQVRTVPPPSTLKFVYVEWLCRLFAGGKPNGIEYASRERRLSRDTVGVHLAPFVTAPRVMMRALLPSIALACTGAHAPAIIAAPECHRVVECSSQDRLLPVRSARKNSVSRRMPS